jgi:hypothetical protein
MLYHIHAVGDLRSHGSSQTLRTLHLLHSIQGAQYQGLPSTSLRASLTHLWADQLTQLPWRAQLVRGHDAGEGAGPLGPGCRA